MSESYLHGWSKYGIKTIPKKKQPCTFSIKIALHAVIAWFKEWERHAFVFQVNPSAFGWTWGWSWLCFNRKRSVFHMQVFVEVILVCVIIEWHNKSGNSCNKRGKVKPCLHPPPPPLRQCRAYTTSLNWQMFPVFPSKVMLRVVRERT